MTLRLCDKCAFSGSHPVHVGCTRPCACPRAGWPASLSQVLVYAQLALQLLACCACVACMPCCPCGSDGELMRAVEEIAESSSRSASNGGGGGGGGGGDDGDVVGCDGCSGAGGGCGGAGNSHARLPSPPLDIARKEEFVWGAAAGT